MPELDLCHDLPSERAQRFDLRVRQFSEHPVEDGERSDRVSVRRQERCSRVEAQPGSFTTSGFSEKR
jgi:hypothetical protein